MIQLRCVLCGVMFLFALTATAQNDTLELSAELRPRVIVNDGYAAPRAKGDDTPVYITQRTRLNAFFRNDKFETFVSLQDVRLWGADDNYNNSGVYGDTKSLSLHQAWVKLKIAQPLSLKVGRQSFGYDDQRIIATRNWNDYQVTYDALLAEYKADKHRLHLVLSYNADSKTDLFFPHEKFKVFNFIHYQYQLGRCTLSGIAVATGNTLTDTTQQVFYRGTYGTNAVYKTNLTNARLSAYYQHNLNDVGEATSAFCLSAFAERKLFKKLSLGLGYDYLSGNNEGSTSTVNNRFDILYGNRHGWYGYMDFFSTTPQQGLQDCMAKLTYKPQKDLSIELHYHYFILAANKFDGENASRKLGNQLGQELDFTMKWRFHEMATLECGYSLYKTTRTLELLKKVDDKDLRMPQFCFIMLTIKPSVLLSSE